MNQTIEFLTAARQDDIRRDAHARRIRDVLCTCQRRLLGIFTIREGCASAGI